MKFFKWNPRARAKVSVILVDWGVRESPHLIHYLRQQTVSPENIEVICLEFYERMSEGLRRYQDRIDIWLALEMSPALCFAKHLMYNAGIALASGEIVVICDLDALVRPTFIERIIRAFEEDPKIVLHIDQFRNMSRKFYPFNFPSIEAIQGEDCINNAGGVTAGILDTQDPIHTRNYGACFCAKRADVIMAGGADMHIDYVGHICGPYEISFRLRNMGRRIVWADDEFMYHTWHPGTDGSGNYLGPHDGRNLSTTAMEFLVSGEIAPLRENSTIRRLRTTSPNDPRDALNELLEPSYFDEWRADSLTKRASTLRLEHYRTPLGVSYGRTLVADHGDYHSIPFTPSPMPPASTSAKLGLAVFPGLFWCVHLGVREIFNAHRKASRANAPKWVKKWVLAPLLVLAIPLIIARGNIRQRIQFLTGTFHDSTNPLCNLALVLRDVAAADRKRISVCHDSKIALCTLRVMSMLRLVPLCARHLVLDGNTLAAIIDARHPDETLIIPSGLYVRYHLDVPPVTMLEAVIVV